MFLGEMHRHMSHEEEQKTFFAAARLFWPEEYRRMPPEQAYSEVRK